MRRATWISARGVRSLSVRFANLTVRGLTESAGTILDGDVTAG